eukprot:scaffold822_cov250-Pinguiococcus_pyrenoidosus.AAC.12
MKGLWQRVVSRARIEGDTGRAKGSAAWEHGCQTRRLGLEGAHGGVLCAVIVKVPSLRGRGWRWSWRRSSSWFPPWRGPGVGGGHFFCIASRSRNVSVSDHACCSLRGAGEADKRPPDQALGHDVIAARPHVGGGQMLLIRVEIPLRQRRDGHLSKTAAAPRFDRVVGEP